jgi:hypothetical protein
MPKNLKVPHDARERRGFVSVSAGRTTVNPAVRRVQHIWLILPVREWSVENLELGSTTASCFLRVTPLIPTSRRNGYVDDNGPSLCRTRARMTTRAS